MRVAPATAFAALALVVGSVDTARASTVAFSEDFEAGTTRWLTSHAVATETIPAGPVGATAAWVTSVDPGAVTFITQYWHAAASPGALYGLDAWLFDNDPNMLAVGVRLEFVDADATLLLQTPSLTLDGDAPAFRPVSAPYEAAPPNTAYLRVVVSGTPVAAGARFGVDGVTVTEDIPDVPVFQPEPPPPAPPPVIVVIPQPTATPRPAATPRARATATPRPAPPSVIHGLTSAGFEQGLGNWEVNRGRASLEPVIEGMGTSLVLTASGATTAWVEQRLAEIDPDEWYEASAVLAPLHGVEAAWLRIAWYASDDASGEQISTTDSPVVVSPPRNAIARAFEVVGTGPVQPPTAARSARVRILVRPGDEAGGAVAIDEVEFAVTEPLEPAPPSPPTPAPTVAAPVTPPTATPSPTSTTASARPTAAPGVALGSSATPALDPAVIEAQRWLRISELMPDPAQAARDAEYEWIEIVNLGPTEANTGGMSITDNRASTPLPAITLQPGEVAVIAGPLAEVDTPWRVAIIGNGLGNAGDTVALVAADDTVVDRAVYGETADSEGVPIAGAPGAGRSIERWFGPDGQPAGARTTSTPSPGTYVIPVGSAASARSEAPVEEQPLTVAGATGQGPDATWVVLIAVAAGLLGGAGVQRAAEIVQGRRRAE
ncbi:MAG: lamin tail domain-containing protein [Dehalococcoidia bacterium]|nr:lamin tail domain-containing protein [Dehalococcoidia bacterium]